MSKMDSLVTTIAAYLTDPENEEKIKSWEAEPVCPPLLTEDGGIDIEAAKAYVEYRRSLLEEVFRIKSTKE